MTLGDLLLKVGITGLPEFKTQMGTVGDQINKVVRDSDKAFSGFDKVGAKLTSIGTGLTAGVTLPLVGVGVAALNVAGNFEQTLAKITAFGDISGDSLAKLRQQALDLGAQTQFSAQQAADGMAVFASAGFDAQQIYQTMPGTLQLAAAGQLAIADAATITKDVLGQFALAAGDSGHVADVLAQAAADSSASLAEMATTLTYAGPVAKGAGQSLEETTAAIVALDSAGIRAEKAGTGLRGMLGSLLSPSSEAAKTMKDLGVNVSDAGGNILPLSDIMEQFRTKLQGVSSDAEKQNIIFGVFGREAGNAAQVLINKGGPALDAIQDKLVNSTGAADRMAKTLNSGLNYAMDQLGGSVETAAIALGTALIPFAKSALGVLTDLLNDFVIPAVDWFGKLPEPVQALSFGLLGVAAAAGPVLFIGGQMAQAFVNIGSAVTTASGLLTKFPGVANLAASALSTLGKGAILAGAAFAAFELGKWLSENVEWIGKFTAKFAELLAKVPGVQWAIDKFTGATAAQAAAFQEATEILKKQEAALAKHGVTVDKAGKSQQEYAKAVSAAVKELASHSKAVTTNGTATDTAARAAAAAAAASNTRSKALSEESTKQKSLNDAVSEAKEHLSKVEALYKSGKVSMDAVIKASDDLKKQIDAQDDAFLALNPSLTETGDAMDKAAQMSAYFSSRLSDLHPELEQAALQAISLDGAIGMLSETLSNVDMGSGMEDLTLKINEGTEALPEFVAENENAGSRVETVWQRTAQQVSTIISDLGKGFAGGIIKLFDNSENNKLDQQADELRTALGSATEEYERHVAEVGAELAGIPSVYSAALEELSGVTDKKLGLIDKEYAASINKIKGRFDEVTKSAAKSLDKQLRDLDEQLRDKKQGYERSVEDANRSYGRDTANLKESLDDKERDYRHWVEEQNLQLQQLEGDNSASAQRQREDIQLALRQRAEDMEDARQDYATALANEEADLKLSLDRKAADYAEAQAEIDAKQIAARETYKQTLADAEADLTASLSERKEEYEADRDNAIEAAEAAKAKIVEKYEAQTTALKSELAKAAGEYDTYKTTVADKLAALEDAHKGPLQRIGDMFKSVFTGAGEALLRFAGEEVMGLLFGKLDTLLGKIPGIGSALGGIFGGGGAAGGAVSAGGSVAGQVAGAGGGGGSAVAGAVSSGLAGTLTAVFSGISAITDVLGIFGVGKKGEQDRFDIMANGITSLARSFEDLGLRVSLMDGMNAIKAYVSSFGELYLPAFASLMTTQETAQTDIGAIRWYADHMSMNSDAIRSASELHLPQLTAIKMAIETQKPSLTINVTGYVGDRDALISEIERKFQQAYAFQGA